MYSNSWEDLKKKETFVISIKEILKSTDLPVNDWEIIDVRVDLMEVEFDVQKLENGSYLIYPMFLGNTLTDLEPLTIKILH